MQSREEQQETWTPLPSISPAMADQNAAFRAHLHTLRRMNPRLVLLVFREQHTIVQGVLQAEQGRISGYEETTILTFAEGIKLLREAG
jgi:hypothetical protein